MSSVSVDNFELTQRVEMARLSYSQFQFALKGAVSAVLNGLGVGLYSLVSMNKAFDQVLQAYESRFRDETFDALEKLSKSALAASGAHSDPLIEQKALVVADALYRGFASDLQSSYARAARADVKTALEFVRLQVAQGRFMATTDQLEVDLEFTVADKMRRQIASTDFISREVNWSYRQQYNTLMVHVLLGRGIEEARVDGGSKAGMIMNLMAYDVQGPPIFHHNSKSLLQPID